MNYCNLACALFSIIVILSLIQMIFMPSSSGASRLLGQRMENFTNHNKPTFVMFHVDWCGYCKKAKPEFEKLVNKFKSNPNIKVVMVDGEDPNHKSLVQEHQVSGYPTIKLCKNGLGDTNNSVVYEGPRGFNEYMQYLNNSLTENFTNSVGDGLKGIGNFFNDAGDDVGGIFKGTARGVGSLYKGAYDAVGGVSDNLLKAGGQLIDAPFQGVGSLVGGEGLDESAQQFAYGVGDSAKDVGQAIYSGIDNIGDGIVSGWNEFEKGFSFLNTQGLESQPSPSYN